MLRCAREQPKNWLARADAAMYAAKRAGRDRVVIAESDVSALVHSP